MADKSKIEWTEATWNPIVGCSRVSPGCDNCYAIRDSHRMAGNPNERMRETYSGLTQIRESTGKPDWTGVVKCLSERLTIPLRWTRPRRIFVNSQSDLFHHNVPDKFIDEVFAIMALTPQHTYQILTKRPERMPVYFTPGAYKRRGNIEQRAFEIQRPWKDGVKLGKDFTMRWPLPNVWLGTSVEDQEAADKRIPHLLQTPADIRFLSCEPLLGPVNLHSFLLEAAGPEWAGENLADPNLDWVIVGGESGPHARPMHPDWVRSLRDQCVQAGVAFFLKQQGEWSWDHIDPNVRRGVVGVDGSWTEGLPAGYGRIYSRAQEIYRVGKHAADRTLDSQEWSEYPI